jgi:hypothetical protein
MRLKQSFLIHWEALTGLEPHGLHRRDSLLDCGPDNSRTALAVRIRSPRIALLN